MGFFSKKKKVPSLPPAPSLPKLPEPPKPPAEISESHELPSLTRNSGKNLNQGMVKSAISDSEEPGREKEVKVEELPADFHFHEKPESNEIPSLPEKTTLEIQPEKPVVKQDEPIFVRIDKFQIAQKDFNEIKKKVQDIESVLRKVNEERLKEEHEISGWMQDLEKIKSRLSRIDSEIFNKI